MLNSRPSAHNAFGFVYMITNHVNGKRYVGQTTQSINQRFKRHKFESRNPATLKKRIQILYHAMKKHGESSFTIECLAVCFSREELDRQEVTFIEYYKTKIKEFGYNIRDGGVNGKFPVGYGKKKEISHPRNISEYGRQIMRVTGARNLKKADPLKKIAATKLALTGKKKPVEEIERRNLKRRIKVVAVNIETNEEQVFDGVRVAARALNLDVSMISKVCKGKHKYYKQWVFRYV
jgi:group I intron endonuclease